MTKVFGEIERIEWNNGPNRVYFHGYAYLEDVSIDRTNKVKKSIIISKGSKKFYLPVENTVFLQDLLDENSESKYAYAGFSGFIDLGFINDMGPIDEGEWLIGLYLNTGDIEVEYEIPYFGELDPLEEPKHFVVAAKGVVYEAVLGKNSLNRIVINVTSQKQNNKKSLGQKFKSNPFVKEIKNQAKVFAKLIKRTVAQNVYKTCLKRKVVNNRVVFLSDSRSSYSGNFEFIYNELQRRGGYEIVSLLKPTIHTKRTLKEMVKFLYYISTSKYILLDDFYPRIYKYKIRKEVNVIQLWHATGAFKTFGFSRLGKPGGPAVRSKSHRNYTNAIVSSSSIKKHYAEAFGISEDKVVATGVPRTDIFFDETYKEAKIKEFYEKYPILKDKKVIMFAPTFRGSGQKTAHYNFEELNVDLLFEKFSDEYVMIMKLHPFIKNVPVIDEKYKDFIIDLTAEREINDLLFITDILITDYSSVCFEFALLNRPMVFFAYDLEEYIADRDFYYPYENFVPGPIVQTTEDLVQVIESQDFDREKLEQFRNRFFDHFDGQSTKRVVDLLLKIEKN